MTTSPGKAVLVALVLLALTACDNDESAGDSEPASGAEPTAAESSAANDGEMSDEMEATTEPDSSAGAQDEAAAEEPPATSDNGSREATSARNTSEDSAANADAEETLDEEQALPNETSSSDVDAIIQETERRFQEASRELNQQFEDVEVTEDPTSEPQMDSETTTPGVSGSEPTGRVIEDELKKDPTTREVDAIIEETERRFEEASREIDRQFEEAERQVPESVPPEVESEVDQSLEGSEGESSP